MEESSSHCRFCKEPIKIGASICKHCGSSQKKIAIRNHHLAISLIISIILIILSGMQFYESRNTRIDTAEVLEQAEKSLLQADSIKSETISLFYKVDSLSSELDSTNNIYKQTTLLSTRNSWIQANMGPLTLYGRTDFVINYEQNVSSIIENIFADSTERNLWWKQTNKILGK